VSPAILVFTLLGGQRMSNKWGPPPNETHVEEVFA